jgi:hypothetical protein
LARGGATEENESLQKIRYCVCVAKKISNNLPAYCLAASCATDTGTSCWIIFKLANKPGNALFEASIALWLALHFMFHRNEQIFVKVELPSVLSAGKVLMQLIVDLG